LVRKVGVDQWQLFHALEKLAVLDNVTSKVIDDVIETNSFENALNLLESAIQGDVVAVEENVFLILNVMTLIVFLLCYLAKPLIY